MSNRTHLFILPTAVIIGIICGNLIVFRHSGSPALVVAFLAWNVVIAGAIYILAGRFKRQWQEMVCLQQASISALIELARLRDETVTGAHLHRLGYYAEILAEHLEMPGQIKRNIVQTIGLHDIGKVAVPDKVLHKPGPLDSREWAIIQRHPERGAAVLKAITKNRDYSDPELYEYLTIAQEIALSHHEHWDGRGYPQGLIGEEIPLSARLAAICDVYDSLRSPRPYKKSFSHEEAVAIIRSGQGSHFDPRLVDSFLKLNSHFAAIWDKYGEPDLSA